MINPIPFFASNHCRCSSLFALGTNRRRSAGCTLQTPLGILCKFLCKCPRRVACLRMSTSVVTPGERRGKTLISSILASRAVSRARTPRAKNMLTVQAVAGHGKVSLGETSRPPSDGGRRNLKTHRLRSVRSARPSPSELTKSIQTGGLGSNLL